MDFRRTARQASLALAVMLTAVGCADSAAGARSSQSSEWVRAVISEVAPPSPSPATPFSSVPPPPPERIDPHSPAAAFAWVDSDYYGNPFMTGVTLTIVNGLTPTQALGLLAPDARTPIESVAKAQAWADQYPYSDSKLYQVIQATSRHGWTLIMEPNGFRATNVATLRRLAAHGSAIVIYNNVNALASFQYASNGEVLRSFDPLLGTNYQDDPPLPQEEGIDFGSGHGSYIANSLALAFRLTGVRIEQSDLDDASYPVAVGVAN